ncbi:hypothetical protein SAMD00023353_3401000 [Rosellinia necatrix]|uniref:Uncharacterized protein n=1 Tax=Rosellinia necatrix TaxID=77044 RepID=A0A1W2TL38_ROSNE|nr:hypothetical protein SAMD00023353_3401000 [Rosellinia necatrix]
MRGQEIANATLESSSAKGKAPGSSSSHALSYPTAESNAPPPPRSSSKRPASSVETEDGTEHQHTRKRARTEGKITAIEHGQALGSDYILDVRRSRSVSPWPGIDEVQPQQEDLPELLRQRRLCEKVKEAVHRWEKQRDLQCEAYRRFRLQRLPSPAPSDGDDDDDLPSDSDADEFGYTPPMLGLDNNDPKVEEVFGLAYTRKLERRKLRKPSHRSAAQTGPGGPFRTQHSLSSADDPSRGSTLEINDEFSLATRYFSFKTSTTIRRPSRPSSLRITRQSRRWNTVFYELDRRAQTRIAKS